MVCPPAKLHRASRSKFTGIFLLAALLGAASTVLAQYRFVSWTTENGLPNNWIQAVHQTRDGYIWITTRDGAARFDGVSFRVFNKLNTPGITTNRFAYRALWEDSHGNLWMGTEDGGVVRYHDGVFTSLTTKDGLPSDRIIRIDGDASGTVWIFTSAGVMRWRNGQLQPRSKFDRSLDAWLAKPKNFTIDAPYFGLWRFRDGGWQRFAYGYWSPFPLPQGISGAETIHLKAISEDAERRLWYSLGARPHDYYCFSHGHLTVIRGVPNIDSTQISTRDLEGRIWMGNHYGAVGLWQDGHFQALAGISTPNVFQVMEDREGNLWIATLDHGLYRLESQVITAYRRPGGVQQANVMGPMIEAPDGTVWLGSGGLTKFAGGRFTTFYRPGQSHDPWHWVNMFSALYRDGDGSLWAGMWDGSIVRFQDGRFYKQDALSAGIKGRLNAILRDRAGDLWFGGNEGLYRLHDGSLTHFTTRDGLPGSVVNVIAEDCSGGVPAAGRYSKQIGDGDIAATACKLWIGTNAGLAEYAGGNFAPVEALRGASVQALYQDNARVWWVGTLNDGLYRIAGGAKDLKITRYTTAEGLYSNRAYEILEDNLGYLWMSCDRGLYRVRKQELNDLSAGRITQVISTHFGEADGLPGECNGEGQSMAFKSRDGRLWFATQDGIAVVDPVAIAVSRMPPPVKIEGCLVDLHPVKCGQGLRLKPGRTELQIGYTALSFIRSRQIRFDYKLEGLDQHWTEAGARRTAYYSHLPPGSYTFRVIAANSDGVWNRAGASVAVIVLPPFYRTWWFLALVSLLAVCTMVLAWRYRVAQLERAHAMEQAFSKRLIASQEAFSRQLIASQEAERKRIAAELHDSVGQSLAIIRNRALLSLGAPEDHTRAMEQLGEISEAASHSIGEVREIARNLRPYHLERLGLTKSIEAMLKRASTSDGVRVTAEIEPIDGLFPAEAEMSLYRIVQEGISNIMKHAHATEAKVSVTRSEGLVQVIIQDNGGGISKRSGSGAEPARGGFGLMGMAERARLLGGELRVESPPEGGTILTLTVRINGDRRDA